MGAPVYHSSTEYNKTNFSSGSVGSFTFTAGYDNPVLIVIALSKDDAAITCDAITYNGLSLTKISSRTATNYTYGCYAEAAIYYLLDPPEGSAYTIAATMNQAAQYVAFHALVISDCYPNRLVNTYHRTTSSSYDPTHNITTDRNNCLIIGCHATCDQPLGIREQFTSSQTIIQRDGDNGYAFSSARETASTLGTYDSTFHHGDYGAGGPKTALLAVAFNEYRKPHIPPVWF